MKIDPSDLPGARMYQRLPWAPESIESMRARLGAALAHSSDCAEMIGGLQGDLVPATVTRQHTFDFPVGIRCIVTRETIPLLGQLLHLSFGVPQQNDKALSRLRVALLAPEGVDAVFFTWRGFMGPKGLKAGEIAYWDAVFDKLAQSEEWKKDTESQFWNADYLLSAATRKHLDRENDVMKAILSDLGLAKQ